MICTINKEEVIEANRKYFSRYTINTDKGIYGVYIRYNNEQIFGKDVTIFSLTPFGYYDPWSFVKKNEFIEIAKRNLKLTPKLQGMKLIGYINDIGVRFRENYGLTENVIRTFNINENVEIIGLSPTYEIIDGNYQHWYQVMTHDGKTGWVYGTYLGIARYEATGFEG